MCSPMWAHWRHLANTTELVLPSAARIHNPNGKSIGSAVFGRPFVKRFALSYRTVVRLSCPVLSCPVCLSVTLVYCGRPNGWMDQDEAWRAVRPRPRPHCVRWRPCSSHPKGSIPPTILAHVLWPLYTEAGDGDGSSSESDCPNPF